MSTIGTIELIATIDTSAYKQGAKEIERTNSQIESSADSTESKSNRAFDKIAKVGLAGVATAAIAAGAIIVKNIGNAVDRIDTLVAFPKMLTTLGASSKEAQDATNKLKESLQGLPTPLQDGAKGVQALVTTGLNVPKATDAFLAFNNAMLASNVDAGTAESTFTQLTQALARGKIEGQEWNSIAANMPTALQALQKESGLSKEGLRQLYSTNPQQLIDDLIRLNKDGGGGIASLEDQARTATGGISTSFSNLNNAVTRGMEGIVKAIGGGDLAKGQERISGFITDIGKGFETGLGKVAEFVPKVGEFFNKLGQFISDNEDTIKGFFSGLKTVAETVANTLVPSLQALWETLSTKVLPTVERLWNALNPGLMTALKIIAAVIGGTLVAGLWLGINILNIVIDVISTLVGWLSNLATWIGTAAAWFGELFTKAWNKVVEIFSGIGAWFAQRWEDIKNALGAVGEWFGELFSNAWNNIKNAFNKVGSFFRGIWDTIVGIFGKIGTAVGDAVGGAFKSVVNGILKGAIGIINGFIKAINGAIGAINKIPGVNIGKLGELSVPQLADGGIIMPRTGGTLANIGEAGEAEAVIPLSKLDRLLNNSDSTSGSGGNTYQISVDVSGIMTDSISGKRKVGEDIIRAVNDGLKAQGLSGQALIGGGNL